MRTNPLLPLMAIVAAMTLPTPIAEAQDEHLAIDLYPDTSHATLEATIGLGVADRSSTSIGDPILGLGYDQSFGPLGAIDLRLFLEDDDHAYVRHGPLLRASHQAGPSMGTFIGHAFRTTTFDLGYAGRTEFRCMRRGDTRVHLGAFFAITGIVSDADRGDSYRANTDAQTLEASRTLDHGGLGGAFGLNLDVHFGSFVAGLGVDIHQFFGIDTMVARDLMLAAQLRLGGEISL